ncbi:RNA ligase [Candidatus Micrarchaeota archaeon]|nr:RNA ligase [Candidatus Micrarchaeota archaeon]
MELKLVREALKKGRAEKLKEDLEYVRFKNSHKGIERGTALVRDQVVWGYPHIKRIFTLEKGLSRNIPPCVMYAEEKIDGFNVRIANIKGKTYGFSRGGFLDSFVTEKSRELVPGEFFKEYPGNVLCGEMIGNTPYTSPADDFDVKLYIFDIDEGDGSYIGCDERYRILKEYGMESPPVLGKYNSDDYDELRRLARSINKGKKEGMVLKSIDRRHIVKYVTPSSDIEDISEASGQFFDISKGFFHQRILRSAFFVDDFGLDRDKYALQLGKAFHKGLTNSIRKAKKGGEIAEEFEILVKDTGIWDDIEKHMSKDIGLQVLWKRREKNRTRIRFQKVYRKTSRKLVSYAGGKAVTD